MGVRTTDVRPPAVAGTWYPGTRAELQTAVDGHLERAPSVAIPCPRGLVAPHAGLVYSGAVAAYAYRVVQPCTYSAAVLIGPSHRLAFPGVAAWARGAWRTPLGDIQVADELAGALLEASAVVTERADVHRREHAIELQLPFVARLLPGVPILPLAMGDQTRPTVDATARALASTIAAHESRGRAPVLLVASSDLSHYHDARVAARMDRVVAGHVEHFDADGLMATLELDPGHACGGGAIVVALRTAAALGAGHGRVLQYADSGDVSGDKSAVVGYLAAAIW